MLAAGHFFASGFSLALTIPPPMPRSRLGPLAIESKLGDHPSTSSVWRAIHVQMKRSVAVKVFSSAFLATPEARTTFAQEWETLKQLQHPSIVTCYGGGFEESDAYLAYELIEGGTLSSQLEQRGRLPWESVLDLAEPLGEAIKYLHFREVHHGQIQPDKILFGGLSPVLIDVRVDRFGSPYRTNHPLNANELSFRAPEVLQGSAFESSADIYSLGAVLYRAITGRPHVAGDTADQVAENLLTAEIDTPASIAMDCPVWFDKLILQMLEHDPTDRPTSMEAVVLGLAEVRRRAMSRAGVAEHTSAGFSPLNTNDQKDREEARALLGQLGTLEEERIEHHVEWHDRPWVLVLGLVLFATLFAYFMWPLSEDQMRAKAETLLNEKSRNSLNLAKKSYLQPMLQRFPDGQHAEWANEQLERVEMTQAEHALLVKMKRNLPLKNEGERLYSEALEFERFGDAATALDRYQSMVTLLEGQSQYDAYVNLARRQIGLIQGHADNESEASQIIQAKLQQADELMQNGKVIAARNIWYSVVELYGSNDNVAPLVAKAQTRLAGDPGDEGETP